MAASPVAVLAIIGIYVAFYAVFGATATTDNPNVNAGDGAIDSDCGLVCGLGDILRIIFDFVELLFGALTFNVPGAPAYIRAPITIIIGASLVWSALTLIRGT